MSKIKNEYEKTLGLIKENYFPELKREEILQKIEHFNFVNSMLDSGPALFIDGLQGSIPTFLNEYNDKIKNKVNFIDAGNDYLLNMIIYAKDKNEQIKNNVTNIYQNNIENKSQKYFYNDYYSSYSGGNLDIKGETPLNIENLKHASDFLSHLDLYGSYEAGKAIKDKDYDNYHYLKNIVEEEELLFIEELYERYKKNELSIDINNLSPVLDKIQKVGEKYDIVGLSVPVMYLFNEDIKPFEKAINKIEKEFNAFSERFHMDSVSVGLGKINYVFSRTILTTGNHVACFEPSGKNDFVGTIQMKEHIKTDPLVRVLDHEYAHAIDFYAAMQIGNAGDFFSELPFEDQSKNPKALEALRKIVYSVSDLENEYLSIESANDLAFNFQKNLFKSLLIHSFGVEEYAKIDQNHIDNIIEDNKEKVLNIFDTISWQWMENRQKIDNSLIRGIMLSESFSDFYEIYKKTGGKLEKTKFGISLQEPLEIIKNSILEYNSRRDKSLHTFFKNPSNFAKEIANVSFNIETYTKMPTERFAWAVGGTDKEEIIPGVLNGFKEFCSATNVKMNEFKVIKKEDLLKKLKDMKQLEVPQKLYTVKY